MNDNLKDTLNKQEILLWASFEHVLLCGAALADCLKNKSPEKHAKRILENWDAATESFFAIIKQQ